MARQAKKVYFGEETKRTTVGAPTGRKRRAKRVATPKRRKYTRRVQLTNTRTADPLVTIQVPASIAFKVGYQMGQQESATLWQ